VIPGQFLSRVKKGPAPAAVLLLGPEAYQRLRLKKALFATVPEGAVTEHDLSRMGLAGVLDDARGLSLFAAERLIWVLNAEAALPRGRSEEDSDGESALGDATPLAEYMHDPTPGVLLVFEASRFDFEGDDKRKQERVRKFYSAIPDLVELRRFPSHEARAEAEALARSAGFRIDPARSISSSRPSAPMSPASPSRLKNWRSTPEPAWWESTTSPPWCRMRAPPPSSPW